MTRKKYIEFAEAVKIQWNRNSNSKSAAASQGDNNAVNYYGGRLDGIYNAVHEILIPVLKADNPRFDSERFINAAFGLEALERQKNLQAYE